MHWNPNLGRSNILIDQNVTFASGYSNVIRIDYTVTNYESFTVASDFGNEAPVMSINGGMAPYRVTYDGPSPWTYDTVDVISCSGQPCIPNSTEPWAAVVADDPNTNPTTPGVAMYVPDFPTGLHFNFAGDATGGSNGVDSWRDWSISASGGTYSWTVYIVLGGLDSIRSAIYSLAGH